MRRLLPLLCVLSCAKAPDSIDREPAPESIKALFSEAEDRLEASFLEAGQVVSRHPDGTPEHQGDSLIWTGMYLGVASCDKGQASENALLNMLHATGGALERFHPLPDEYLNNPASMDGALGLYWGVANRVARCPETRQVWLDAMALHASYLEGNNGRLNGSHAARLVPEFDLVLDRLVGHLAGTGGGRNPPKLNRLLLESIGWATATVASRKSGFRIHLVLLALQTLEASGETLPKTGWATLCQVTKKADMPTLDAWCGRGGLLDYIDSFKYNEWEMRLQRAGAWEQPDGNGLATPGLDLLVAIRQAYTL